jgi:SAM-dependent methyltransferase
MASGSLAPFYGKLTTRVQASRLRAARPHLAGSVLDVGCGLTDLPGRLASYVGCDRDALVLAENRRRFPKAEFVEWDVAAAEAPAALSSRSFDTVLMLAILEHLADPAAALARASALMAPDGELVVTTPHPAGRLPLEFGARLGLLSRHADEEHETLLGREALARAAAGAGLVVREYRRFLLGWNQLLVLTR